MSRHPASGKFAIAGLGVVAGHQPDRSERMLAAEATRLAMEDAGLKPKDIGGAIDLRRTGGGGDRASYSDAFPRLLGLNNNFYFVMGRGGALAGLGMAAAMSFIERGIADYVVLTGAVTDWSQAQASRQKGFRGMNHAEKRGYWGKPLGDLRAGSHHSWMAARHMAVYGTTSRQLGHIAVGQRAWAQMNPDAYMCGRPMTIEDYLNSPLLVEPYHLLDISLVSDGAVSFILTSAERAQSGKAKPVYVLGQGFGEVSAELWWEKKNFTHMAVAPAKAQAFSQAGIELGDVDCAQFYDCFTAEVLFQVEDYGFCPKGEGGAFIEAGHIAPGGSIPVNTSGGLLSCYHLGDLTGLAESVLQLRGQAGARQIADCDIVITTGHGGELVSPGMCSIHTCTVLGRHP
jgi:acetyl-CoA acetyltransferase